MQFYTIFGQFTKILIMLMAISCCSYSHYIIKPEKNKAENIRHRFSDGDIIITYDLNGSSNTEYNVKIFLKRRSNNTFQYKPKNVSGDIGKGLFAGKDKQILWKISKEFPSGFFNEDFYFEISIDQISASSGSNTLLWIGAGAAVIGGGIAAYFLWLKPKDKESFPEPPIGRPY